MYLNCGGLEGNLVLIVYLMLFIYISMLYILGVLVGVVYFISMLEYRVILYRWGFIFIVFCVDLNFVLWIINCLFLLILFFEVFSDDIIGVFLELY